MTTIDKIRVLIKQPKLQIQRIFYSKPIVMTALDTVDYILSNKCSVSRFGDGEIKLLESLNIACQQSSRLLTRRLREVAHSNNSNCLVCIPNVLMKYKELCKFVVPDEAMFWTKQNLALSGIYYKEFNNIYGDARFTRFYLKNADKKNTDVFVKKLKLLWENRNILFVEGEKTRLGVGNDLFSNAKSTRRILCPNANAFAVYDKIYNEVIKNLNVDDLVICALGPTATILCYDLCKKNGVQALDLGHIDMEYEWFLKRVNERVSIDGKYCGECKTEFVEAESMIPKDIIAEVK